MATTMYFEDTLRDETPNKDSTEYGLEFGTSTYNGNGPQIYFGVDGHTIILSEEQGRKLVEAMHSVGSYLGYV